MPKAQACRFKITFVVCRCVLCISPTLLFHHVEFSAWLYWFEIQIRKINITIVVHTTKFCYSITSKVSLTPTWNPCLHFKFKNDYKLQSTDAHWTPWYSWQWHTVGAGENCANNPYFKLLHWYNLLFNRPHPGFEYACCVPSHSHTHNHHSVAADCNQTKVSLNKPPSREMLLINNSFTGYF